MAEATVRGGDRARRGLCGAVAMLLAPGAAASQPAAPPQVSPQAQKAALAQLVTPTGVGGCVYHGVSEGARHAAVESVIARQGFPKAFQDEVAVVGPRCSKRPYSRGDFPLVGSVTTTFVRIVLAYQLATDLGLGQRQIDEAWHAASPDEQAPYLKAARQFFAPGETVVRPGPEAVEPFRARLKLPADLPAGTATALDHYLVETAIWELAEAQMAAGASKTAPQKP